MTETLQGGTKETIIKAGGNTSDEKEGDLGDLAGAPRTCVGQTGYPLGSRAEEAIARATLNRWDIDQEDLCPGGSNG